ncbi:hypothetical protein AVEN_179160-1 [Araneus ventricosus]|uniref:Uncharacterized protein n=1 Tax=Araneus ventricosus TaxID=182803 RepID=A0A4Y2HMD2_ARAVE|nr:hypothetical protein AVEN_179160-1 [Araneus ventricosus]
MSNQAARTIGELASLAYQIRRRVPRRARTDISDISAIPRLSPLNLSSQRSHHWCHPLIYHESDAYNRWNALRCPHQVARTTVGSTDFVKSGDTYNQVAH